MITAITNNKGGQGKTVTTVNLGHCLANRKRKVLVVDMDSQCNTTSILGPGGPSYKTLYNILDGSNTAEECIYPTAYSGMYVLPNTEDTAALEPELLARQSTCYTLLRDRIRQYAEDNFDYTLLDCPPNLGLFSIQAMTCADSVIVPVEAGSRFAVDGLTKTVNAINAIRASHHPGLRLLKILLTQADMRTSISKVSVDTMRERFGDMVFETIINKNTAVQQAEMRGMTLIRHNPKVTAARNYTKLAREMLSIAES